MDNILDSIYILLKYFCCFALKFKQSHCFSFGYNLNTTPFPIPGKNNVGLSF